MDPEISILVLTHNQRCLLERCLESILKQIITVPYEIIVSDDGSNDGTMEYVKQLGRSVRVTENRNLIGLRYFYCNSDEYSPKSSTQRIGWNRLNAYKHARGKYFVNVDADDFLVGTDLYQKEFEILETHPECSMVQTRLLKLDEGKNVDEIYKGYPKSEKLENGSVFSLEDVLRYGLRGQHQTYMYRRRPHDDMERILGCGFDDINITYYHLQFGSVVFMDMTGYVWVQYTNSDSKNFNVDDYKTRLLPLNLGMRFKKTRYVFLRLGINKMWNTIITAPVYPELSERTRYSYSHSKAFIYRFFSEKHHGVYSWSRYCLIWMTIRIMKHFKMESKVWLDFLYSLMV